jgi:ABC-type transport system involved in cytochrome bd biosynthesis fused ATPase/permease subunit
VRENILFGSAYNEARYREVLDACALEQDLKQFELGDETEVGEKGTVLSGGQKARIGLARAIYSPAKVSPPRSSSLSCADWSPPQHILLDDVLSAVDSHTAQHLFAKCLTGRLMRHRTCVLVTHAVDLCLPGSSYVVSMDNGVVVACGAPDQISLSSSRLDSAVASKQAEIEAMASTITIEAIAEGKTDVVLDAEALKEKKARMDKLKLVKDETQSEGSVNSQVYL